MRHAVLCNHLITAHAQTTQPQVGLKYFPNYRKLEMRIDLDGEPDLSAQQSAPKRKRLVMVWHRPTAGIGWVEADGQYMLKRLGDHLRAYLSAGQLAAFDAACTGPPEKAALEWLSCKYDGKWASDYMRAAHCDFPDEQQSPA